MDVAVPGVLRPDDLDTLRATLRDLKATTELPVLFGGAVQARTSSCPDSSEPAVVPCAIW